MIANCYNLSRTIWFRQKHKRDGVIWNSVLICPCNFAIRAAVVTHRRLSQDWVQRVKAHEVPQEAVFLAALSSPRTLHGALQYHCLCIARLLQVNPVQLPGSSCKTQVASFLQCPVWARYSKVGISSGKDTQHQTFTFKKFTSLKF